MTKRLYMTDGSSIWRVRRSDIATASSAADLYDRIVARPALRAEWSHRAEEWRNLPKGVDAFGPDLYASDNSVEIVTADDVDELI